MARGVHNPWDKDSRIERIMLWLTTPHPILHPCEWLKMIKRWLKKLVKVRDYIAERFLNVEAEIEATVSDPIVLEIERNTRFTDGNAETLRNTVASRKAQITAQLNYWAQWQKENL